MGGIISSLLPGRSVSGTLASLCVLFALAPAPAHAGVVSAPGDEAADSSKVAAEAAEQDCTVRFEHQYVGIGEGIFAVLFVVMDTKPDGSGGRRACYQGERITIKHEPFSLDDEDERPLQIQNRSRRQIHIQREDPGFRNH